MYYTMEELVLKQRSFFNSNQTKPIEFRIKQLEKLRATLIANESLLFDAIYDDFKKSKFDAFTTEIALLHIENWYKNEKANIEKGILQAENGEVKTTEEVLSKYRK